MNQRSKIPIDLRPPHEGIGLVSEPPVKEGGVTGGVRELWQPEGKGVGLLLAVALLIGTGGVTSGQSGGGGLTLPDLVMPTEEGIPVGGGVEMFGLESVGADDGLADLEDYPTVDGAELPSLGEGTVDGGGIDELGIPESAMPIGDGMDFDPLAGDLVMPTGGEDGVVPMDESGVEDASERGRRDYGIFKFTLGGSVIYDDNIFITAREEVEDVLYVISPGVSIDLGDSVEQERSYLYLNYNPELVFFQENSGENAIDQNLEIGGAWKGSKLSVAATAGYQNLHGATVDAAGRTDRQFFYGNVVLSYGWGVKTSVETGFYYEQSDYGDLSDSREFRNESFVDYQITGKTRVGGGVALGRLESIGSTGGGQDFQQLLLRGSSQVGAKLAVSGRVGADFRQSPGGDSVTPVFGLGATYEPTSGTLVAFDASRELSASASEEGEVYTRTAAELGVRQRFMRRWKLGLDGGVEKFDYSAAAEGAEGIREESGYFVRPSLRYDFKEGMRGELFYMMRKNDSNLPGQSYGSNQVGVSVGVDF